MVNLYMIVPRTPAATTINFNEAALLPTAAIVHLPRDERSFPLARQVGTAHLMSSDEQLR